MSLPRILLLSNSTMAGTKYMEWVKDLVTDFLVPSKVKEILFIPFAGVSITFDEYTHKVQEALPNFKVKPIHKTDNYLEAVKKAEAIMIGGGNTFHLLYKMYEFKLVDAIKERIMGPSKIPYVGWSAGSNLAGPDIGTTNDMPIIWPPSDKALGLVPYNLNPHYNEWSPPNLNGETRMVRLNECILIKKRPIVAYSEGVAIRVENGKHKILAPKLKPVPTDASDESVPDTRCVKVWIYKNNKPEIVQVPLNTELDIHSLTA